MDDEISQENVTHGTIKGKPESPRSDNNNNNNNNNKEQDRFLPIANVSRILKKVIPSNGKISKDAKETIQECVSEFISFVTGEASDKCQREKRKTINGDDIIWAITTLGFEEYVGPLKLYLSKYRDLEEKVVFPKQHRPELQKQHQLVRQQPSEYEQSLGFNNNNNNVYSSLNVLSHHHPSFVPSDQPFSLPFSPNSFQKQLQ
ncbi:nuclear factor Y, subunit B7 [Hibiscus trionum]|uniref:Nuclear factor Y, subunit B7 n=1 Tax=Hibiscus trionum TaxID=183268 RepID=A0A9W7MEX5_HIBTR|nr:nuclear factor Y, subunit B7 [Hibiscus trionum]